MRFLLIGLVLLCRCLPAAAQTVIVKGTIMMDTSLHNKSDSNAVVSMIRTADSVPYTFTRSDSRGNWLLPTVQPGRYKLVIRLTGYNDYTDTVIIPALPVCRLPPIYPVPKSDWLGTVVVSAIKRDFRVRGDTLEFKPDSLLLRPGNTVEDMLKRTPGFHIDKDGKITLQGEPVQKILIDGEEFFSDDPAILTKTLSADMIKNFKVYDKKSPTAALSGLTDNNKTKTLDLSIKPEKKVGLFGRVEASGDGNRYWNNTALAGAFKRNRQTAVSTLQSTVGQGAVSTQNSLQYGNLGYLLIPDPGSELNLGLPLIGAISAGGNPHSVTGGGQYADRSDDNHYKINASYQYGQTNNTAGGAQSSTYLLPDTSYRIDQTGTSTTTTTLHRLSLHVSAQVSPRTQWEVDLQTVFNTVTGSGEDSTAYSDAWGKPVNNAVRSSNAQTDQTLFGTAVSLHQDFGTGGRKLLLTFGGRSKNLQSAGRLSTVTDFFSRQGVADLITATDQYKSNRSLSQGYSVQADYSEPVGRRGAFILRYGVNGASAQAERTTFNKDSATGQFDIPVDSLSGNDRLTVLTQNAGLRYRLQASARWMVAVGFNASEARYKRRDLQTGYDTVYRFLTLYPQATVTAKFDDWSALECSYNGATQAPSITQIQPLPDNSDPLNIRIGNPALKQAFRQTIDANFHTYQPAAAQMFRVSINWTSTTNDFGNQATVDSLGRKITMPVNVNGNRHLGGSLTWSKGFHGNKLYMAVNASYGMVNSADYLNSILNRTRQTTMDGRLSLRAAFGRFEILANPGLTINRSVSSVSPGEVTRFWQQDHSVFISVHLPAAFELNSDCRLTLRPKADSLDKNNRQITWNSMVAKTLWHNAPLLIRFTAYDLLNNNRGFQRTVTGTLITESNFNTIQRYFLLSAVWHFSHNKNR